MYTTKFTLEDFIKKANLIHDNKYDYNKTNYINYHEKVIVTCKIHGDFVVRAGAHLSGCKCRKCSIAKNASNRVTSTEKVIDRFRKVHGLLYDYSLMNYINGITKIDIICPIHGTFSQTPSDHNRGSGCKKCKSSKLNIFKKSDWVDNGKNREGTFYILKCNNFNEEFYKLGITINSVKRRYDSKSKLPYNYEIIKEVKSKDLDYIWNLEKRFKNFKKKNHYIPKLSFGGHLTECFKN